MAPISEEARRGHLAGVPAQEGIVIKEKITEEAWRSARAFFEDNKYIPWILIAGADVHYEFQQAISRIHLAQTNIAPESLPMLFDAFSSQFNLELRRLIIEYKDGEIEALRRENGSG